MDEELLHAAKLAFSDSYFEARAKFRNLAAGARAYGSAARGPGGESLFTDAAWFGDPDARKLVILLSAVHGVEGYCGSACQIDWLARRGWERLGRDEAMLLVHAVNPYGFSWDRRVTEEGCDLNRNFIDFDAPIPHNEGYDALAEHLVPRELDGPVFEAAEAAIAKFRSERGEQAFQEARKSGQYRHPHGVFFGGFGPSNARNTLERIAADYGIDKRDFVVIVDVHTGLGPFGYGELQCEQVSGLAGYDQAAAIFGPSVTSPELGTSSSVLINGTVDELWQRLLGERHVYVCLEYGTYDPENSRRVLRQDHWLHAHSGLSHRSPVAGRFRAEMRKHYNPGTDDWNEMVIARSRQVLRQAVEGLRRFA